MIAGADAVTLPQWGRGQETARGFIMDVNEQLDQLSNPDLSLGDKNKPLVKDTMFSFSIIFSEKPLKLIEYIKTFGA